MEFGIKKIVMLVMKSGNRHMTDAMNNQMRTKLERSEEMKPTNTRISWRLTPSNKCK